MCDSCNRCLPSLCYFVKSSQQSKPGRMKCGVKVAQNVWWPSREIARKSGNSSSSSSSSAFDQPHQTLRSSAVRNWTVRRRSSAVPHSLMVVDTSSVHVCLLCTSHRGQSWSTRRSPQLDGGGHLLRPRLSPLRVPQGTVLEHVVHCLFCCLAVSQ